MTTILFYKNSDFELISLFMHLRLNESNLIHMQKELKYEQFN